MKSFPIIVLGVLIGLTVGLGLYTFVYAKGYAYLTNNPQACTNCHVMQEYYDAWENSGHRAPAMSNWSPPATGSARLSSILIS